MGDMGGWSENLESNHLYRDYDHFNLPCLEIKSSKMTAITDTGTQPSLMELNIG